MNTKDIENQINKYMQDNSNFYTHRNYLGISHVAGCPRRAYNNYMNGMEIGNGTYRMSFVGYEQENSVKKMLADLIIDTTNPEVVAPFDNRLRGHIDGATQTGNLIEIKSVTVRKFEKILQTKKALQEHFNQCQLYMRYGHFDKTFIIYRCRETYEHIVLQISYLVSVADKLEQKAKTILQAIDAKQPPACECGHCER